MKKRRDMLLDAGLDQDDYKMLEEDYKKANRRIMLLMSGLFMVIFIICAVVSVFVQQLSHHFEIYLVAAAFFLIVFLIIILWGKKIFYGFSADEDERHRAQEKLRIAREERDRQFFILSSMSKRYNSMHLINLDDNTVIEYAAATHIRDVEHNNHDAASYMRDAVTKAADPRYKREMLEFTDLTTLPKRMSGIRNISQEFLSSYVGWVREEFIAIDRHEDGTLASVIFTTQIINAQKLKEEKLIHKSITDEITGLLNRRAYEEDLLKIEHTGKTVPFVLVAMDVNGLKTVNDTLGHAAGDELIQGASFCIRTCFGDYGKIYRIGGDEFMAILTQGCEKVEELLLNLKKAAASWSGKQIQELAISAGYARSTELQDAEMEAYEELADKRMYDAKAQYYAGKGVDRRGRKEFLDLICKSYTYILSVNLTNNSFAVIHAADEENLQNPGYHGNFSEWMSHFVDTGQVCEEDRQEYFNQTHLDELKTFFRGKNERMVIKYRSMPDGNYVHILMEMIKTKNYTEDHQEIFLYVKPIDA